MKMLKRIRWAYLVLSIFLIAIGVCLLAWPDVSLNLACCILGGGAMLFGLAKIVIYFVRHVEAMVEQYDFSTGVLCIAGGAALLMQPAQLLQLLPQALAAYMLIDCVFKIQVVLDAKRLGSGAWIFELLLVLICIVGGVCVLIQPFGLDAYVSYLIAGGLLADGILNFVTVFVIAAVVKKPEAEDAIVTNIPDPTPAPVTTARPTASEAAPKPAPAIPEEEEMPVVVADVIEDSRARTNQPEGKGSILGFFKKK